MQPEIIVEVGNSHEGSLGVAKSFVDLAAEAGAKIIKFQMHIPEAEGMPDEPFRKFFSDQDSTRQDYWRRINFSENNWKILIEHTKNSGLEIMCTPFSIDAAQWLFSNKAVERWKVGSGDAVNFPLIDYLVSTNLPLIISTGLISWNEIIILKDRLVNQGAWGRTTLLHCISKYPVKFEEVGFQLINEIRALGCSVGFSDHSGHLNSALYALSLDCSIVEVHMVTHKKYFGPDTTSSLLPEQIEFLCQFAKDLNIMKNNRPTKDMQFKEMEQMRKIFRKGVYWSRDLPIGDIVKLNDLIFRKPVRGIDSVDFEKVVGRKISKEVFRLTPVNFSDLEE